MEGAENCPATGGFLVLSNHLSYLDPPLLGGVFPRPLRYLAKKELFFFPFGVFCRMYGAFPIDREGADRNALERVKELVAAGEGVVLFPEGTRSRDGRLGPFRGGAIRLACALASGAAPVPIVPVGIDGSDRVLPRGAFVPRPGPRLAVRIGAPFTLPGDLAQAKANVRSQVAREIAEKIAALLPTARRPGTLAG